jgi:hypothetical protein
MILGGNVRLMKDSYQGTTLLLVGTQTLVCSSELELFRLKPTNAQRKWLLGTGTVEYKLHPSYILRTHSPLGTDVNSMFNLNYIETTLIQPVCAQWVIAYCQFAIFMYF